MSDKPAAYQLGMYISAFFIVVFVIFTYWSFSYNKNLIRKNAETEALLVSSRIISKINEKIVTIEEISTNLTRLIPYLQNVEYRTELLNEIVDKYEYITSIHLVLKESANGQGIGADFRPEEIIGVYGRDCVCPSVKAVIQPMETAGNPGWSEPYVCPKDSHLVVLYYFPFQTEYPGGGKSYSGYIACEISLDFMNSLILQSRVGKEGFAFLISGDGTFITHPMKELVLKRNLFAMPPSVFKGQHSELVQFMSDDFGSITVYPDYLQNAASIAYHMKIPATGWVLATTIPYHELNRDLYWLVIRMSAILFMIVAAIFSSIFYISGRIMKPLSSVTREIHKFSSEAHEQEHQVKNEAEALSHSLKRLRKTYEKFRLNEAESQVKSQIYQRDLHTASEIQRSIIPPEGLYRQAEKGITLYSVFRPANVISGDLYDFFMVDEKHFLITIGDVSGSGVPAALFMGVAHTFIKSFSAGNSAKNIVRKANKVLCRNNSNQFFLTLFLGILNIEEGTLNYCNAGHTPAYILRNKRKLDILDKPHGLPLGLYPERNYDESTITLKPGDKLVLYTDGITELSNREGQLFGERNLQKVIAGIKKQDPENFSMSLMNCLDAYRGSEGISDDLSLLVLKYALPVTGLQRESA